MRRISLYPYFTVCSSPDQRLLCVVLEIGLQYKKGTQLLRYKGAPQRLYFDRCQNNNQGILGYSVMKVQKSAFGPAWEAVNEGKIKIHDST